MKFCFRDLGMIHPFHGGIKIYETAPGEVPAPTSATEAEVSKMEQQALVDLRTETEKDLPKDFMDYLQVQDPPLYEELMEATAQRRWSTDEALKQVTDWMDDYLQDQIEGPIEAAFPQAEFDVDGGEVNAVLCTYEKISSLTLTKTPDGPWLLDGSRVCVYEDLASALKDAKIIESAISRDLPAWNDPTLIKEADRKTPYSSDDSPYVFFAGQDKSAAVQVDGSPDRIAELLNGRYNEYRTRVAVDLIRNKELTLDEIAAGYTGAGVYKGKDNEGRDFVIQGRWKEGAVYDGQVNYAGHPPFKIEKPQDRNILQRTYFTTENGERWGIYIMPKTMEPRFWKSPSWMTEDEFKASPAWLKERELQPGYDWDDPLDLGNFAYHADADVKVAVPKEKYPSKVLAKAVYAGEDPEGNRAAFDAYISYHELLPLKDLRSTADTLLSQGAGAAKTLEYGRHGYILMMGIEKNGVLAVNLQEKPNPDANEHALWEEYTEGVEQILQKIPGYKVIPALEGIQLSAGLPTTMEKDEALASGYLVATATGGLEPLEGYEYIEPAQDGANYAVRRIAVPAAPEVTAAQKPAAEEAPVVADTGTAAPAEVATVDVRADAKANPEKYMDGDKTAFKFKAEKGSDADLHVRVEDIYATTADQQLTLTSSRYAGMEFKYNADRGSFYQSNPDGTFTDQRLVIRGGDTIATKPVEAAPLVADAQAPAAVDTATVATAETVPVTVAEVDPQAAEKAAQYISAIHTLADQAQHQTMVFAQNGTTREKDPEAWKQVDDKYAVIQRMLDDSAFDISKAPRTTAEEGIMADSVVALRDRLPQTRVALNIPDAKKDDGTRVVDNHDTPAADTPAPTDGVTDGDTGTTKATPTPTTLG